MERSQCSLPIELAVLQCLMSARMVIIFKTGTKTEHALIVGNGLTKISCAVSLLVA